jgi:RimJ/RimL family protein N-acetyltransferase
LPVLHGDRVTLREVQPKDAVLLQRMFADREVQRHVSPGPRTADEFRRFITWVREQRRVGRYLCFTAIDADGRVAGLFQLWPLEPGFGVAEWGFALARGHWGTGLFADSARMLVGFARRALAVRRLESRVPAANRRARAALHNVGAVEEGTLLQCFAHENGPVDYVLSSILTCRGPARQPVGP